MEGVAYYFSIFLCNFCILLKFNLLVVWGYNEDYCPLEFNVAYLHRYVSTFRTKVLSSPSGQNVALKMKRIVLEDEDNTLHRPFMSIYHKVTSRHVRLQYFLIGYSLNRRLYITDIFANEKLNLWLLVSFLFSVCKLPFRFVIIRSSAACLHKVDIHKSIYLLV